MNLSETLELLRELKDSGASHFKSSDFEVTLHLGIVKPSKAFIPQPPEAPKPAPVVENTDATEKLKDLIETLKLDDVTLMNKIFPDGAEL